MQSSHAHPRAAFSTSLGMLSILFWSTTVAFSRHLTENLGTFTAAAGIYVIAGGVGLTWMAVRDRGLGKALRLPPAYLLGCGGLFVLYTAMLYLAIGWSANRQQAIEVGVVNYLWPSLTILFSVPILGRRARVWLVPGIVLALAGVAMGVVRPESFSWLLLTENLRLHYWPYVFALVGAVTWGVYSNLSRRLAGPQGGGAVPLFMVGSAVALLLMGLLVTERSVWSAATVAQMFYMGLFPGLAGYVFWDLAMRRGHLIMVASLSNFIPLFSTIISCLYLRVPMGANLWVACGLLVAGAAVCKWSIHERATEPAA